MVRLHFWLTVFWVGLTVPTVLYWRTSILWVLLMSIWSNVATHWSAYQGARAERVVRMDNSDGDSITCSCGGGA